MTSTDTNKDQHTSPGKPAPVSKKTTPPHGGQGQAAEEADTPDPAGDSPSRPKYLFRLAIRIVLIAIITMAFVTACVYMDLRHYATTPMQPAETEPRSFEVQAGQGLGIISNNLERAELIRIPWKFRFVGRLQGFDRQIKQGEYLLSPQMSPQQIFEHLISGKVILYRITFPEGYTYRQMAAAVAEKGFTSAESFIEAATDPALIAELGLQADSLEGYLFPDTYRFPKNATARNIIHTMYRQFQEVASEAWRQRCQEVGLTVHEAVTLASIIEKETAALGERPVISSVFHNRLEKGMRLETDPTVIYGLEDFDGDLTRKDLRTPTPYNTYVINGLPPGPIANPGAKALHAAVHPDETDYLFFVSKKNGRHQFSTSLKDHNRAVRKYQLNQ